MAGLSTNRLLSLGKKKNRIFSIFIVVIIFLILPFISYNSYFDKINFGIACFLFSKNTWT